METICRALLAYCLLHYRGDENIKSFIWDLITPSEDGTTKTLTNHSGNANADQAEVWVQRPGYEQQSLTLHPSTRPSVRPGLSTPVPRGRKGKKGKPPAQPLQVPRADWLANCNPEHILQEDSYKRHLKHHCNK